jgi:predicted ATPase
VLLVNDDVTVLIGANGVGKSNAVSFFQLLNYAMTGSLQTYIAENGFADAFLYYG